MPDQDDLRVRHLDTIQATISRLGQNSFTIRGWSVTLVSAVFALLTTQTHTPQLLLLALVPTATFWGLDAYYLRQERLYRRLYTAAANHLNNPHTTPDITPFDMDTTQFRPTTPTWPQTLLTPTVAAIPGVLTLAILITTITQALTR
jgi:hypothetical protein